MGLYDTITVRCPSCGNVEEFQTKSGDCTMSTYWLETAPADMLDGVNWHGADECDQCGVEIMIDIDGRKAVIVNNAVSKPFFERLRKLIENRPKGFFDYWWGLDQWRGLDGLNIHESPVTAEKITKTKKSIECWLKALNPTLKAELDWLSKINTLLLNWLHALKNAE